MGGLAVEADRAAHVRADLAVSDVAVGRPVLPPGAGPDLVGVDAHGDDLGIGGVGAVLGERGDDPTHLEVADAHERAVFAHEPLPRRPRGRLERAAGAGTERPDGEQEGEAERTHRAHEQAREAGQAVLGPEDQADPEPPEADAEERALELGLAATHVHHGEAEGPEGADDERGGDALLSGLCSPGHRQSLVPIQ